MHVVVFVAVGEDYSDHWTNSNNGSSQSSAVALLAAYEGPATRTAHQMGPQRR